MTTITIKKSTPIWKKKNFSDDGDLLDYLLENHQIGKLQMLPKDELTSERQRTWEEVDKVDDADFIDIR